MSIQIDKTKCIGCGMCADICPGNLLKVVDKVSTIRDVKDCWGCTACVKICPKNAICYQLSADLGGAGSKLFAVDKKSTLTWILQSADGLENKITIDKTQSNKY